MPLSAEDAAKQIAAKIKEAGGWKPGNVLDAVIGFGANNTAELQKMLDQLLTKKGVLTPQDEAAIKVLFEAQEAARKKRNTIRTRYFITGGIVVALIGTATYLYFRKK